LTNDSRTRHEEDFEADPLAQFQRWFAEAANTLPLPEAAALATADVDARPSVRMVLVKGWDERGLVFYSNYDSRKGKELSANSHAALLFHWQPLGRQVRLEGPVERVEEAESDRYFESRPRASQLGAVASAQSRTIGSRDELDQRARQLQDSLEGQPVLRPTWWGGYRLQPLSYEFWLHQEDRLHDRIRYLREESGWRMERLQP
jgi:pyridoxamine 5'-phosphate oxidase